MRLSVIILLSLFLVQCSQETQPDDQTYGQSTFVPIRDLTSEEDFQNVLLDQGITLFHSKVIAYQGQLIISSRGGRLLSLTMDGEVNWSLERQGNGPGEFFDPHDMQVADDMIGILNTERARISLYTIDGQFYKDVLMHGSASQFGMVDGAVHIFYPYDTDFLFAMYDIETGKVRRYGEKDLIEVLPDQKTSQNFMFYRNLLRTDDRYTVLGLVHYAQLLIFDREENSGILIDLSEEKEIAASLEMHREEAKKFPPGAMTTSHFLDLAKIGDYFGVMVPGPWDMEYADLYRINSDGQIHDKVYKVIEGDFVVRTMENMTLLDDETYFGHIRSRDRLVIFSIAEQELPSK